VTQLYFTDIEMPGAELGGENPLPDFGRLAHIAQEAGADASLSEEERRYVGYGRIKHILPYRLQDGYDRVKILRRYPCAVLENTHLKAVFFPQFGGRLWSLYDKDHDKRLVQENPVFQPCNLALRNAWVSGGIEWNIGMTGHTPFTLSPLHTARGQLPNGTPVLRLYEWERIRRVLYQLDFILPEDSSFLFVRVILKNTQSHETPIYWWSNTAVDETDATRVLAPVEQAFVNDYNQILSKRSVPMYEGVDCSYAAKIGHSMDFFFDVPAGRRKWECALDKEGMGLVQTSTDLLQGRKLFVWGQGSGGKHWQEYLARPGERYLEIQAGLANTQMECLPMPAEDTWEWLEAYGAMQAEPETVHGAWTEAVSCVEDLLEEKLPRARMDALLAEFHEVLEQEFPVVSDGSGWAALELERRGAENTFSGSNAVIRRESLGKEQEPWLLLLHEGVFPNIEPDCAPAAFLTQPEWIPLLEKAAETTSDHWHTWFQLGVMYYANGRESQAERAFEKSMERTENAWAIRCLALLQLMGGDAGEAMIKMRRAVELKPIDALVIEFGRMLLDEEAYTEYLALYDTLAPDVKAHGRVRALRVEALIQAGRLEDAEKALMDNLVIADMREGELTLSELWIMLHMHRVERETGETDPKIKRQKALERYPVPQTLDFRMHPESIHD
jgi:tetratricopeptide (TPR) repeat protein